MAPAIRSELLFDVKNPKRKAITSVIALSASDIRLSGGMSTSVGSVETGGGIG
jgi:uncharacterized protein YjeT (DUF2065 family)